MKCRRRIPAWTPLSLFIAVVALAPTAGAQTTAPFAALDNVEGPWVNFNWTPIRPLTVNAGTNEFWAVNTHDSTVEHFTGSSSTPAHVWGTPWTPVAIEQWAAPQAGSEEEEQEEETPPVQVLLVVCRGSNALVQMDRGTGTITKTLTLPAEPGDILVDQATNLAYVTCAAVDSVVEIDLVANVVSRTWSQSGTNFRQKNPLFLSWDVSGANKRILVAPLYSGNNSTSDGPDSPQAAPNGTVFDLKGTGTELPDEDLFVIDPVANTVSVVAKEMGTILFAHGVNPVTQDFWQLNTDANNKNPAQQSEPTVLGDFIRNRVTIVPGLMAASWPYVPSSPTSSIFKSLDPGGLGGSITTSNTVGQPYGLAFAPDGSGLVAGLLTDNVLVMSSTGAYVGNVSLPAGSIPRAIAFAGASSDRFLVYCWGTNVIHGFTWPGLVPISPSSYNLTFDPTPPLVKAGRAIFYDADKSQKKNASCASCHVDGRSDLLMWNLSNMPMDDKGPMLTQTLAGLQKLAPFHWRGERSLRDFNGAFPGLLGATAPLDLTPGGEMDQFEAYVFSIQNPMNPFEDPTRVVNGNMDPPFAPGTAAELDAVAGQTSFFNDITFVGAFTCNDCHLAPTGTNNDIHPDAPTLPNNRRAWLKPAPFHELWRRQASTVTVNVPSTSSVQRSFLGAGFSHSGQVFDLFKFIELVDQPTAKKITSFVWQWDQGIAPAAQTAYQLDASTSSMVGTTLTNYLVPQANLGNCDIAVFGTIDVSGTTVATRWYYDRAAALFRSHHNSVTPRTLATFVSGVANGESNVFLGLPVGTGERFGVDYDFDGTLNRTDTTPYAANTPATNPTLSFTVSPTKLWNSTKVARLFFETSRPTTALVEYRWTNNPNTAWQSVSLTSLSKRHSVILNDLRPSTAAGTSEYSSEVVDYEWKVTVTDLNTNVVVANGTNFRTLDFIVPTNPSGFTAALIADQHKVNELAMIQIGTISGGVGTFRVNTGIAFKRGALVGTGADPAPDRVVAGRVMIKPLGTTNWVFDPTTYPVASASVRTHLATGVRLVKNGANFGDLPMSGPFLVSEMTDANGDTPIRFTVSGLQAGDQVLFNIENVIEVPDPTNLPPNYTLSPIEIPVLTNRAISFWSFPDTTEAFASISMTAN